jgi:hydroxymethylpyrimidine pyrophosphatase-like HAD family hydrolase
VRFRCLATDYDGTLAEHGRVAVATRRALARWAASGREAVLVTGRLVPDLERVFPELDLFSRVVAENGAVLYDPGSRQLRLLAEPPPSALVTLLRASGVASLEIGRVIVATYDRHEREVRQAIATLGVALDVIRNKDALMILPRGVDKATGLAAALAELNLSLAETVAVGDAENDAVLLAACGQGVAVANGLPALKASADWVTRAAAGQGVVELVDRLLESD